MLSVAEARCRILDRFSSLSPEVVSVADALGRVLAEDLAARATHPPQAVSAMDGYAIRTVDIEALPTELGVVGTVPAGQSFAGEIKPGQAVRIFTGAPLPDGADAVVIQEDTSLNANTVSIHEMPRPGQWIRTAGLDFERGDIRLRAGRRLSARDVGLAAAMDRPWLTVHRRPRVAVLATGDEVVLPGDPRRANQIVSSNSIGLCAFLTASGAESLHLGVAPDDAKALAERVRSAWGCDLLLTTGGASVGDHDLVKSVLTDLGADLDFWKIAMRPGKPLMFGHLDTMPILGLPGNPVSGLVCATIFLQPVLETMQGRPGVVPTNKARLGAPLPENGVRESYLRAATRIDEDGFTMTTAFETQDSSVLSRLADADALIQRPPSAPPAEVGEFVPIIPLNGASQRI